MHRDGSAPQIGDGSVPAAGSSYLSARSISSLTWTGSISPLRRARFSGNFTSPIPSWDLIFSAYNYPYAIVQLFGGWLADMFGPRMVLGIFGLIFSLATIFTGFAGGFLSLIGLRGLLGVGEGPSLAAATRVIINWLPRCRWSFAQGLAHTFSRIANSVTPLLVAFLILKLSWRISFFVVGAFR